MKARRWMAWYGTLQISPHPRQFKGGYPGASAEADKRKWEKEHPDKIAEVKQVDNGSAKV